MKPANTRSVVTEMRKPLTPSPPNFFKTVGSFVRSNSSWNTTPLSLRAPTSRTYARQTWQLQNRSQIRPQTPARPQPSVRPQSSSMLVLIRDAVNQSPNFVLWFIIGLNTVIFLGWSYARSAYRNYGDPGPLNFMAGNFMCSWDITVLHRRFWTAITSSFSHSEFWHYGINMFVLYSFGRGVLMTLPATRFLNLYLLSALATSATHLIYHRYLLSYISPRQAMGPRGQKAAALGASGSVMAMTILFAAINPYSTIYVYFFPVPAWLAAGAFVSYDIYRSAAGTGGRTATAGHVGGAVAGFAYYWWWVKPFLRRF
ncbi:rhomboid-domain-containing protein [Gonapodya prolifera JEL478]|uniref:Rhomboid-domain-containing protein n=1 Tax=Gonapodya prolifera (strain JEL478) TaxID=1344416 RepID=A0A139AK32_GONPJ|nr:rhomboid-domain-containing protein [Gonapodya prolifera JEL478]|eukprot:KXS17137.1 rhomboid-domain-containing protein [Gonapodya prolifera JEL478]